MVKLTVSGNPGSGTSTLVAGIGETLGWSSLNGGQVFRDEAENRKMSLEDFGKLCLTDLSVDRMLDEILKTKMQESDGPEIVESRLAGWWAHKLELSTVRLWVEVSDEERAIRVVKREGGSVAEKMAESKERSKHDNIRFTELYQLNPEDTTPYTHILKADTLDADGVLAATLAILRACGMIS